MSLAKTCKSATLKTNKGDITVTFYNEDAPVSVANFCTIAKKGDYDDVIFHRVIKNFMIQGGDPDGTGRGGPGYQFDDEIHANNNNKTGTISMANAGPGTNGSQFFINTKDNSNLDTKHTVFGEVTKGMETVTAIENTETGAADKPVSDIVIKSVELEMN
ncbi:MAG: peptidylprolyl isomerase [Patescibacteria group bacterium]